MGTCTSCQRFLGAGEVKFCSDRLTTKAVRCRGCRVRFEPDGQKLCKNCRNTELLFDVGETA